ncbi:hypothetical protein [Kitasatospora sp. NPDC093806]|uniref:hypothetical protein n=1 Tax=Kitasatospora sp. NPDC093806 TaxID=3155075 RepID=UPI00341A64C4
MIQAIAAVVGAVAALLTGAGVQSTTGHPWGERTVTATTTATVTTTTTTTATATVTATVTATAQPAVAAPPAQSTVAGTPAPTTAGAAGTAGAVDAGWLLTFNEPVTVAFEGRNFAQTPPGVGNSDFRVEGTPGGDPYIQLLTAHQVAVVPPGADPGPTACRDLSDAQPQSYGRLPLHTGDRYCMHLVTYTGVPLAVLLTALSVKNNGPQSSSAKFATKIWSGVKA